ncbi:carboxypeptidase-like regulatory domain-containing protein [Chitinophaga pinensis]|uniref:SusC/RagA family TonB-linked outer membrane protein n=1 Tax=Chitinophaga pinensis TaxID=79329 RepID=A0A5C6LRK9_9BACT|nr:carboxypeptidase-like regulatory domain-containing protein [Chitinophaga pinensis]TWV99237.1 hypothetical protein FEF09_17205 [Chitinophaga pinensis]
MKQITPQQFAISSDDKQPDSKQPETNADAVTAELSAVWGSSAVNDHVAWKRIQVMRVEGTGEKYSRVSLPGVTVTVKGKANGTVTDVNGHFEISVPGTDAILLCSYVGYFSKEIPVGGQQSIQVVLNEDTRQLNQVVVVGFGTQKKVNLTVP